MIYHEITHGQFVQWDGGPVGEIQPPGNMQSRPASELQELGLYRDDMIEAAVESPGKTVVATNVKRVGGVVRYVHTFADQDIGARRAAIKEAIKAKGLAVRRAGFFWNFGTPDANNTQVLQLRAPTPENDDEKNWLTSLTGYTAMVMLGQGHLMGARFRTESNQTFTLSYADGMALLLALQGWAAGLFNTSWMKQEEADASITHEELDVVEADIPFGWGE